MFFISTAFIIAAVDAAQMSAGWPCVITAAMRHVEPVNAGAPARARALPPET